MNKLLGTTIALAISLTLYFAFQKKQSQDHSVANQNKSLTLVDNKAKFPPTTPLGSKKLNSLSNGKLNLFENEFEHQIREAKNLRVLFEKFKQDPQNGGIYYASAILSRCKYLTEIEEYRQSQNNQPVASDSLKKKNMKDFLKMQCNAFLKSDFQKSASGMTQLDELKQLNEIRHDALMTLMKKLLYANTKNESRQATNDLIDSQSQSLMASHLLPHTKDGGRYFDGKNYNDFQANAATVLALCQIGYECGPGHFYLVDSCIFVDFCTDDIEAAAKNRVEGNADWQSTQELATKIAEAIKKRNLNVFIPSTLLD